LLSTSEARDARAASGPLAVPELAELAAALALVGAVAADVGADAGVDVDDELVDLFDEQAVPMNARAAARQAVRAIAVRFMFGSRE
jgi:N-methylhydantoinase A/oxoprolinase/acetone carboxylase beta subunit